MRVEYIHFNKRAVRSEYIAENFAQYLKGKVLDVGCDEALLKSLVTDIDYTGIDVGGSPDLVIDLEEIERLPFDDNAFDSIVCSDVLEHLDQLHHIFFELVRVSGRYLVISLPNNWCNARRPIEKGHGHFSFYGLPASKPVDRHKWFFGLSEAKEFFEAQQEIFQIKIIEMVVNEKPRSVASRILRRIRYPRQEHYLNRYAHTLWVVFEVNN